MQGGELFSFIQERAESAFTERGLLFKKNILSAYLKINTRIRCLILKICLTLVIECYYLVIFIKN